MQYVRYSVGLLLMVAALSVVLFAAPIWPIKVVTMGYNAGTKVCLVPFPYSDYGWIRSMPPGWLIQRSPFHPDQRSG